MINPQNHITNRVREVLSPIEVWSNRVPRGIDTPESYIIVSDMNLSEAAQSKREYEWIVGFNLDITSVVGLGYDAQDIVNNIVEDVVPKMKSLTDDVVEIKNVDLIASRSMTFDTSTNSITRQILTYEIWVNYGD